MTDDFRWTDDDDSPVRKTLKIPIDTRERLAVVSARGERSSATPGTASVGAHDSGATGRARPGDGGRAAAEAEAPEGEGKGETMKRHSWVLHRTWQFWERSTRRCVRCKALVKLEKSGPRGGQQYSYRSPDSGIFVSLDYLPECSFRRAGGGPPVSSAIPSFSPEGTPAVGPMERVEDIIARYEQYAAEWRAKGRTKEAEAMDGIVANFRAGTATDPRTVA